MNSRISEKKYYKKEFIKWPLTFGSALKITEDRGNCWRFTNLERKKRDAYSTHRYEPNRKTKPLRTEDTALCLVGSEEFDLLRAVKTSQNR